MESKFLIRIQKLLSNLLPFVTCPIEQLTLPQLCQCPSSLGAFIVGLIHHVGSQRHRNPDPDPHLLLHPLLPTQSSSHRVLSSEY